MKSLTSHKTDQMTESIIRVMTRLATENNAVNLSQGFPDYESPPEMLEAAQKAIRDGLNQYAPPRGAKSLRDAVAKKFGWYQGLQVDPETEVTITCGTSEGVFSSLLAVINPGDEVIIFEPFYESYGPDSILVDATPRFVTLHKPKPFSSTNATTQADLLQWAFNFAELEAAFNNKTKVIIINTPNNPTGKVFTREELEFISKLCQKWNVIALTDEIYEHIFYDGQKHISIATLPGMHDRTITINAISKTYSASGWRVGWTVAAPEITNAIRKVHDFLAVCAPHPLQEAAAAALNLPVSYYEKLAKEYLRRREFLLKMLTQAGFKCWKPFGAYYTMADFSGINFPGNVRSQIKTAMDFARWLVTDVGVAGVPASGFYHDPAMGNNEIRFSFGRTMEVLMEAEERFKKLLVNA